jgi:hypothetical protein
LEDAGGEILRVMEVPRSVVNVVEDAFDVALIEQTKGISVSLGCASQDIFFVEFEFRHVWSLPAGSVENNPDGFWKLQGV